MMMKSSSCALCAVNKSDEKSPLKKGPPLFISPSSSSFFFKIFETLNTRERKKREGEFSLLLFTFRCFVLSHNTTHKVVCRRQKRARERLRRETTDSLSLLL